MKLLMAALFLLACAPASDTPQTQKESAAAEESFESVSISEIARLLDESAAPVLLDVRSAKEFDAGHIPTAINLSHELLPARISELLPYKDEQIVIYCRSGRRAKLAYEQLAKAGFEQLALLPGDMIEWTAQKRPLERTETAGGE